MFQLFQILAVAALTAGVIAYLQEKRTHVEIVVFVFAPVLIGVGTLGVYVFALALILVAVGTVFEKGRFDSRVLILFLGFVMCGLAVMLLTGSVRAAALAICLCGISKAVVVVLRK